MEPEQTKPSPMVRIADLLHRVLKLARRRWYVTLVLMLIGVSPVLIATWRARKVQVGIIQLEKDNPQVNNWDFATVGKGTIGVLGKGSVSHINLSSVAELKDLGNIIRLFLRSKDVQLDLNSTQVSNIRGLKGMPLIGLDLSSTNVSDISALKGMSLTVLFLFDTKIIDINSLEDMPLTSLDFAYTKVTDISVLKGIPLAELYFTHTVVIDISALKGMPLAVLDLTGSAEGIEFLRSMKTLEDINSMPVDKFWKEYDETGVIPE